jgi:cytochrome o ubiquinol oxidase subunit 3
MSRDLSHESFPDVHHDSHSKTVFGFWLFLLTEFILFGTLFATYAVLRDNTFGGPSAKELFKLPFALEQALILLACSFTAGLGGVASHRGEKKKTIFFFLLTFILGAVFLGMDLNEFSHLVATGNGWQRNGFLSAFFTVVGTHALHIALALLWTLIHLWPVFRHGITAITLKRLTCLRMFWQFLNVIWVYIFTFIYLMGSI